MVASRPLERNLKPLWIGTALLLAVIVAIYGMGVLAPLIAPEGFDETNLDTRNARIVFDIFERLVAEQGRSVVVVTHDQEQAARALRQVRLVDGRIVHD
ncbi:MAG: hypothetical protein K6T35_00475, partial [Meiothermus silvanus]|nr:hypothetical protein [Allomeiothermus silvanus]